MGAQERWVGMILTGMKDKRQNWAQQLRSLSGQQKPRTAEDFLRQIVESRGRTLILIDDVDLSANEAPCGMWLSSRTVDVVWVDPSATGAHRDAILCHEAGHMINGDEATSQLDLTAMKSLMASNFELLDSTLVTAALGRTTFDERRERRAELFGTWAALQLARQRTDSHDPLLSRVRGSLDSQIDYW